ncbi:hypothetical protein Pan153_01930 [Gimesia panareensis]|uniref:Uncharacterized protein n=1 Tax=Gimesia panareensis TaxID=2527978 RepID=A0A518FGW3_9PLAN|nr:hypothetical protein [Gimesia panareensis]QDV15579.1 hypothetical protein Pan153_01930 [Gimesia panareensis]
MPSANVSLAWSTDACTSGFLFLAAVLTLACSISTGALLNAL